MLLALSVVGLLAYAGVNDLTIAHLGTNNSMRYVTAFVILLFGGIISSIYLQDSNDIRKVIRALILSSSVFVFQQFLLTIKTPSSPILWKVANNLQTKGINPGDQVATINLFITSDWWAKLAHLKVTADIPDSAGFFKLDQKTQNLIYKKLKSTGVKAVVYKAKVGLGTKEVLSGLGWKNIEGTDYYFLLL